MAYSFILLNNRFVSLRIIMNDGGLAAIIKEELGFIKVFLVTSQQVKFGEGHFRNLVSWYDTCLSRIRANLLANDIGIADGNVEEFS